MDGWMEMFGAGAGAGAGALGCVTVWWSKGKGTGGFGDILFVVLMWGWVGLEIGGTNCGGSIQNLGKRRGDFYHATLCGQVLSR